MLPGELLAVDVAPSRWVVLRVLAEAGDDLCVVMTRWSGSRRPSLRALRAAREIFEPQPLTHHRWNRPVLGGWVRPPAPETVTPLGRLPLKKDEAAQVLHPSAWVDAPVKTPELATRVLPATSWSQLVEQVRKQWRWDHDRAALLAEEAAAQVERVAALQAAMDQQAAAERAQAAAGLEGLVRHRFLPAWEAEKPRALARAAERLFRDAVKELRGSPARSAPRRLRELVEGLNALHARHRFDGDDVDDLVEALRRLAYAAKLSDRQLDALDAARDF